MALADNPIEHILHMFGMEMRTNPTHACEVFPHGTAPAELPLQSGELAYGCLLSNYFFTPLGFIWKDNGAWHRFNWADIVGCSTTHGSDARHAIIKFVGGSKVKLPLTQFGPGWGGRIGQLFFAMIERWRVPQRDRDFVLEPDKFFKLAKQDDTIAPNLFPSHPGLEGMRARLRQLEGIAGIEEVFLVATDYEDEIGRAHV